MNPDGKRPSLLPAESMALTVALAQVQRGEDPSPNVASVCVYALARLVDRYDYTEGAAAFLFTDDGEGIAR